MPESNPPGEAIPRTTRRWIDAYSVALLLAAIGMTTEERLQKYSEVTLWLRDGKTTRGLGFATSGRKAKTRYAADGGLRVSQDHKSAMRRFDFISLSMDLSRTAL